MIVQNICASAYVNPAETAVFFHASTKVAVVDNSFVLASFQQLSFNGMHNLFNIRRWREFCGANAVFCQLQAQGQFTAKIIAVKKTYQEFTEQVVFLASYHCPDSTRLHIDVPDTSTFDLLYLQVETADTGATIGDIAFGVAQSLRRALNVALVAPNAHGIAEQIKQYHLPLSLISVDADSDNQAKYIAQSLQQAQKDGFTHVIYADKLGQISIETLFRTLKFFECVIDERQDIVLLSLNFSCYNPSMFCQYDDKENIELLALDDPQVAYKISLKDTRRTSYNPPNYFAFSTDIVRRFGVPMDNYKGAYFLEYLERIDKELVLLNGINCWVNPNLPADDRADYYQLRNQILNLLLQKDNQLIAIQKLFWARFSFNLQTYNYAAATLNIYALNHIIKNTYSEPSEDIHHWVSKKYAKEQQKVATRYIGTVSDNSKPPPSKLSALGVYLNIVKNSTDEIEKRALNTAVFAGRNEVYVVGADGNARVARINRKQTAKLSYTALQAQARFAGRYELIKTQALRYRQRFLDINTPYYSAGE